MPGVDRVIPNLVHEHAARVRARILVSDAAPMPVGARQRFQFHTNRWREVIGAHNPRANRSFLALSGFAATGVDGSCAATGTRAAALTRQLELGPVELGGWDRLFCWTNPPPFLLESEIAPHADFAIFHALISPKLEIHSLHHEAVGEDKHYVRLVLLNSGWLPTNLSQKALDRKAVRPVEVELTLPEGARVVGGERKLELGQLAGRNLKRNTIGWRTSNSRSRW